MSNELPRTAYGNIQEIDPSTPEGAEELRKDEFGFTNPNLHRRLDIKEPSEDSNLHDEESTTCEIP